MLFRSLIEEFRPPKPKRDMVSPVEVARISPGSGGSRVEGEAEEEEEGEEDDGDDRSGGHALTSVATEVRVVEDAEDTRERAAGAAGGASLAVFVREVGGEHVGRRKSRVCEVEAAL